MRHEKFLIIIFALTMTLSGFLLFQVEPIMAKFILPWFGGSATTWIVCMMFFQLALLLGYLYAYILTKPLPIKTQIVVHSILTCSVLFVLPITSDNSLRPPNSDDPTWRIVYLLMVSVGAPYVILASTSPLFQRWLGLMMPSAKISRFFAISNFGSSAGLLSYPFLIEPFFPSFDQTTLWSKSFVIFAICNIACAFFTYYSLADKQVVADKTALATFSSASETRRSGWLWVVFSAFGSVLLLAVTNKITQWSAVIPFLWVLPLAIYLLTFVLCFGRQRADYLWLYTPAFLVFILLSGFLSRPEEVYEIIIQLVAQSAILFFGCMMCHSELVRLQPKTSELPYYYLIIAAGGALGGIIVSLIAPFIFNDYWEYPLSLCAVAVLVLWRSNWEGHKILRWTSAALAIVASITIMRDISRNAQALKESMRNFYGVVQIVLQNGDDPNITELAMQQAGVDQGSQYVSPARRSELDCAYDSHHALGLAWRFNQKQRLSHASAAPMRIGVIGLGAGMVAAHAKPNDYLRYYEINQQIVTLENKYFTYLANSHAKIDIIMGDARFSLEREAQEKNFGNFDLIIINAFRGAAPPLHLMTKEAFDIYLQHLAPAGIVAVNFELDTLELSPLHRGLADAFGMSVNWFETNGAECDDVVSWALYTKDQDFWRVPEVAKAMSPWRDNSDKKLIWTDANSNLFSVIKWSDGN